MLVTENPAGRRAVTSLAPPTVTRGHRVRGWSVGAVVSIGCTIGLVGVASAGSSSVPPGSVPPCLVEIETGADESLPSTTLPGTCSISATSGTVPAPPVLPPVVVADTPPSSSVPVWSSDLADRLIVMRLAVIRAVRWVLFLSAPAP
ncbi:MAG: hypothetical protein ABW219_07595 [Ilumatobacteraceae bacterium]